jgi:hypothetical protein
MQHINRPLSISQPQLLQLTTERPLLVKKLPFGELLAKIVNQIVKK